MLNITQIIENLRNDLIKIESEINRLTNLSIQFPDIIDTIDRWQIHRLSSKIANSMVDNCDIKHSCGCCNDCSVKIYPYVETEFGKVYSNPTGMYIGSNNYNDGDVELPGWQELLRKENMPEVVIRIAEKYFKDHLPTGENDE